MKLITAFLMALWLSPAAGQDGPVSQAVAHVFQVVTFAYPGYQGSVRLWPTERMLRAKGRVWINRVSAITEIDAWVDDLPPAPSFDCALNTYVLWVVSPEGYLGNAGEFVLHGDDSLLRTSTTWAAFGMFVTAEPNRFVKAPSEFVVLVNAATVSGLVPGPPAIINYACPQVFQQAE